MRSNIPEGSISWAYCRHLLTTHTTLTFAFNKIIREISISAFFIFIGHHMDFFIYFLPSPHPRTSFPHKSKLYSKILLFNVGDFVHVLHFQWRIFSSHFFHSRSLEYWLSLSREPFHSQLPLLLIKISYANKFEWL